MIIITSTGQAIKAKVASYATTQPDMYSSYVDSNAGSTFGFTPAFTASTVDTLGVPIMDAPASGHERQLKCCSIFNTDTAPVVVTVYQTGSATYTIQKCTLQVGDTLHYEDSRGWYVVDSNGQVKTGGSSGNSQNYRKNSTGSVYTRPRLNIIEGSGVTVTLADDSTDNEVDVTIAAAAGGGSPLTTKGDLYAYSTTNTRRSVGTDGQVLKADSGDATGVSYTWQNVIQRTYDEYTANSTLSTRIPADDTIPQNTEGTEILSRSITPKSASSRIRIWFTGTVGPSTTTYCIGALFVDSAANALDSCMNTQPTNYQQPLMLLYEEASGSMSARTYKIRVGSDSGTCRMNGDSAGRYLGGTQRTVLVIEEIMP